VSMGGALGWGILVLLWGLVIVIGLVLWFSKHNTWEGFAKKLLPLLVGVVLACVMLYAAYHLALVWSAVRG
jgi:hypothetical protein